MNWSLTPDAALIQPLHEHVEASTCVNLQPCGRACPWHVRRDFQVRKVAVGRRPFERHIHIHSMTLWADGNPQEVFQSARFLSCFMFGLGLA